MGMLTCFNSKLISTCNVSSILYHLASSNSTTIGSIDEILSNYYLKKKLLSTSRRYFATAAHPVDLVRSSPGHQYARWWWLPGAGLREKGGNFNKFHHILFDSYILILFWSYRTLFYAYQTYGMFVFIPFCWCYIALPQICCNRKMQLQLPRPRWRTSKTSTWRPSAPKRHWRSDIERRWHRDITSWTQDMTQHNPSPRKHT